MRILEINVFNYRKGGSEAVYFSTIEMLKEHGHEVLNFALKWKENCQSSQQAYFPESKETRRGFLKPFKNVIYYFYNREAAKNIEELICKERPDIAQIHLIWGQLSGSILRVLKKHGIPIILTIHEYRLVCPAYTFRNGLGQICEQCKGRDFYFCIINKCCKDSYGLSVMMAAEQYFRNKFTNPVKHIDGLIYVSNFAKRKIEQYMPAMKSKPNIVLYNLSDKIISPDLIPVKNERYYLFFGRLSYEKGIMTLISAFNNLPSYKLKIAGTGPLETELKEYTYRNNMSNVEFLGYKTGEELTELIKNAYFIVVPSEWYENNPMTIIEGYATGVPVIGANIGGIPEIIENGKTGWLFEYGNIDELQKRIEYSSSLSNENYKEMCINAINFARANFNKDKYYPRLVSFLGIFKKICQFG